MSVVDTAQRVGLLNACMTHVLNVVIPAFNNDVDVDVTTVPPD